MSAELPPVIQYSGEYCGSCSYCCWSLRVSVPAMDRSGRVLKPASHDCHWLCFEPASRCSLHGATDYPESCRDYVCPYVLLESPSPSFYLLVQWPNGDPFPYRAHRPDRFQGLLNMFSAAQGVMPVVPFQIPVESAIPVIIDTGTIMAAITERVPEGHISRHVIVLRKLRADASVAAGQASIGFNRRDIECWNRLLTTHCRPEPRYTLEPLTAGL